jgi:hypothetical protein
LSIEGQSALGTADSRYHSFPPSHHDPFYDRLPPVIYPFRHTLFLADNKKGAVGELRSLFKPDLLLVQLVALFEFLHPPSGIYDFAFAGKEGVALTAQLYPEFLLGRTGREGVPACADDPGITKKFRMNLFFHYCSAA